MNQYILLKDGCHHWLKVSLSELQQLDIHHRISRYSYADQSYAYLEDELDLFVFLQAKLKLPAVFCEFTAEHIKAYKDFFEQSCIYEEFHLEKQYGPYPVACPEKAATISQKSIYV